MGKYHQDKFCVYLDQFAVSYCVDPAANQDWQSIRSLLEQGVAEQKLVIPYSMEHLLESSLGFEERALRQDGFLFRLSNGWTFRTEGDVVTRLLLNRVRNRPIGLGTFSHILPRQGFAQNNGLSRFGSKKQELNELVTDATRLPNQLHKATAGGPRLPQHLQQFLIERKRNYYRNELLGQLRTYARHGFTRQLTHTFSAKTIPRWSEEIMKMLIYDRAMSRVEARKIKEMLEELGLEVAAPLFIRATLEAAMEAKQQQQIPNDFMDIQRLVVALPFADVVLTDKAKCYDVKSHGLDTRYKTEVYSGSKTDLQLFKQRLSELVTAQR